MLKSYTKVVSINCLPDEAHKFLSNVSNWPIFATRSVKQVNAVEHGFWLIRHPDNSFSRFKLRSDAHNGIIDYITIASYETIRPVWGRIVQTMNGIHYIVTYIQDSYDHLSVSSPQEIGIADEELRRLKMILETNSQHIHDNRAQ